MYARRIFSHLEEAPILEHRAWIELELRCHGRWFAGYDRP